MPVQDLGGLRERQGLKQERLGGFKEYKAGMGWRNVSQGRRGDEVGEASRGPGMKNLKPVWGVRLGYTLAAINSSLGFEVSPALSGEWVKPGKGSYGCAGDLETELGGEVAPHSPPRSQRAPTCVSTEMRRWA